MADRQMKGILGTKLGMTQVFDENNRIVPVTVIKAGPNVVTQVRTTDNDGYTAVQLAFGAIDPRKVNKPKAGHYQKAGVTPRRFLAELRKIRRLVIAKEVLMGRNVEQPLPESVGTQTEVAQRQSETAVAAV